MTAIANTGDNTTRLNTPLLPGEFFYTTDTGLTYIGTNGGYGGSIVNEALMSTAAGGDGAIQFADQGYLNSSPNFTYTSTAGLTVIPVAGEGGNVTANCIIGKYVGDGSQLSNVIASGLSGPISNITVLGNSTSGNLTVLRSTYVGNNLTISGNFQANGTANLIGAVRVYSDLTLVGDNLGNNVGNVTAGYFKGNGALLTGIVSSYSNANVAAYLASGDLIGPIIAGNITLGGNVDLGGNVNCSRDINSNGNVNANGDINSNGNIELAGDITLGGDIDAGGDINSNGNITLDGDIDAGGNINSNGNITLDGNVTLGGDVNASGNIRSSGGATFVGNITLGGNINSGGNIILVGNINSGGDINSSSDINSGGTITGLYLAGDGSNITNLNYSNANVGFYLADAQVGNIIPDGDAVHSLGNVTNQWKDLYVSNTAIYLNNVPVSLTEDNVLTVNGQPVLSNDSNVSITTTGNIISGNISTSGQISGRIKPRTTVIGTAANVVIDSDSCDQYNIVDLAEPCYFAAPSGTPDDAQKLTIRIKDDGFDQDLSFDLAPGGFTPIGVTLPTTTVSNKYLYIGCIWNAESNYWDVISVSQQV